MIDGKDFVDFTSGLISFFKKVFRFAITSIKEYFGTFLFVCVLTAGIGLFCWYNSKEFYEAVMVCTFREMNKKDYGEMIHNLDLLIKNHSYEALAKNLDIPVQDAQNIISIEGKNMVGSMLYEDITPDKSPMYFDVKATNNKIFTGLQPALLNYINAGSLFINNKAKEDSIDINNKLQYLNNNISAADSIISAQYALLQKWGSVTNIPQNAQGIETLLKYKNSMETQLAEQTKIAALPKTHADSIENKNKLQYLNKNIALADAAINTNNELLKKWSAAGVTMNAAGLDSLLKYKSDLETELIIQKRRSVDSKKPVEILHGFIPADNRVSNKNKILQLTTIAAIILSCFTAIIRKAYHDGINLQPV